MATGNPNFVNKVCADANAVAKAAADEIVATARRIAAKGGTFSLALSGGSTPKTTYSLLAADPLVKQMPWASTKIFFGDERHVRPDHPDSNYRMAYEAMLKSVPIPQENVFAIPTGGGDPAKDAEQYEATLKSQFPAAKGGFPNFSVIMLGIGPDGHTASLFPGTPAPKVVDRWMTACNPLEGNPNIKPAVKRVTITPPVIWNADLVYVLATGAEKKPMLAKIFAPSEPENPPVSRLLRNCKGQVIFFLDKAAAE